MNSALTRKNRVPSKLLFLQKIDFDFNHFVASLRSIAGRCEGVDQFRIDYLISELIEKYPFGEASALPSARREAALVKLLSANETCRLINSSGYRTDKVDTVTMEKIIRRARALCAMWLGPFDYGVYQDSLFTAGATTSRRRSEADPYDKYRGIKPIHVGANAYSRLLAVINCTPLWCAAQGTDMVIINNFDKVDYVPKNALEDRCIVPQQDGSVYLQKALAGFLVKGLRRAGISLRDQTYNQELARRASIAGSEATLDMKNASALMNYRIVWDLMPDDFFRELDACRNTRGRLEDGSVIYWEMFSSMGNGFNFELESMVFLALATAACEHLSDFVGAISVYGDDIIVPSSCAHFVCDILYTAGFTINEKKTHINGPFRESCGAHWYRGIDVKPFYIRQEVNNLPEIIRLCNRIRKWSSVGDACDPRFEKLWRQLANQIPPFLRGGRSLEANYALCDGSAPAYRLAHRAVLRPIRGWAALLRFWQNQGVEAFCYDGLREASDSVSPHFISRVDDRWLAVKANITDMISAEVVPLFPSEYRNYTPGNFGITGEQSCIRVPPSSFIKDSDGAWVRNPKSVSNPIILRDLEDPNYWALRGEDIIDLFMMNQSLTDNLPATNNLDNLVLELLGH